MKIKTYLYLRERAFSHSALTARCDVTFLLREYQFSMSSCERLARYSIS